LLALFPYELLNIWTRNTQTASHASQILAVLAIGNMLNGLASIGGYLQSAAGWPALLFKTNAILAVSLVPLLWIIVPKYGAIGGAFVWLILSSTYVFVMIPMMHRRLLRGEMRRWYMADLFLPLSVALSIGICARNIIDPNWPGTALLFALACEWGMAVLLTTLICPAARYAALAFAQRLVRE